MYTCTGEPLVPFGIQDVPRPTTVHSQRVNRHPPTATLRSLHGTIVGSAGTTVLYVHNVSLGAWYRAGGETHMEPCAGGAPDETRGLHDPSDFNVFQRQEG